jgi:hypothetical protein
VRIGPVSPSLDILFTIVILYFRNRQAGVLEVDGLGSVGKISPGKLKQLNTENGLYIGKIISHFYDKIFMTVKEKL